MSDDFDINAFSLDLSGQSQRSKLRRRSRDLFIKGPIPLSWARAASKISGSAARLTLALWFQSGVKRKAVVQVNLSALSEYGLDRFTASRALAALEAAKLVSVDRQAGRNPRVTILASPASTAKAT